MENSVEQDSDALARYVRYFESSEQATTDSRQVAEKARDYYDGKQWTKEEADALKKRKQPAITNNRIKPKVDFLLGQETQRRSNPHAYPRTPKHEDDANSASDALVYVTQDQKFDVTRSKGFEHLCIEGLAGVDIPVEQVGDDFKVRIYLVRWDRLFYDPHSRAPDFSDAKYLGQVIWMDFDDAVAKYPEGQEALEQTLSSESSTSNTYGDVPRIRWADPERKRVRVVELWHQEGDQWHHCIFTKGGVLEEMVSPYVDEEGNSVHGMVLGSAFIDRDGNRYGAVKNWLDIQDEINKRRSKALHLMSVRQTWGNQATGDVKTLRTELAKPDGHVQLQAGAKMGEDFGVLPTGDMAAAQVQLLNEAKQEIDAVGVNAAMSGTESRNMSGRALLARNESGLSELGPLFDSLKQWELNIYRAVWWRIRQFWTAEKWIRVTDDEKNVRFVGLNRQVTLGEQLLEEFKKQPNVPPEVVAQAEQQAKFDPAMQQIVGVKNNVAELDVDIMIDDVPASASLQIEQFQQLADLAKMPHMNIPPKAIIEASSLRNKDKILKEMGADGPPPQVMQMQKQMHEMSQQMAEMHKALMDKQAEQKIKAREVGVKEYAAKTDRMTAVEPAMTPQEIQAIVVQTIQDLFTNGGAPAGPPPQQPQPQQQPAPAGFFTPEPNNQPQAG